MATEKLKSEIVRELMKLKFGEQKAKDLIEEHIDVVEVNEDELTPAQIAQQLEEQFNQGY